MTTNRMGYTSEELRQFIEPGRDGHRQNLNARVLVSGPKEAPRFALFDTSNPIEKMRLRGTLGRDEAETGRRYRAARLWARLHHVASSGAHTCEIVDRVQGSGGGGEDALARRLDANHERVRIQIAGKGMTLTRFFDLDACCAIGVSFNQRASQSGRHHSSVQQSVISGLDAVATYEPWQRQLDAEPVLKIDHLPRRKGRAA